MKVNLGHSTGFLKFLFQVILIVAIATNICTDQAASQISDNHDGDIKIGLLIPDDKSLAAVRGAELAVREANEKGGLKGSHFQLVVRSMEGPWGTGSKEAVSLIFDEKVWALLGSHDGRNAHTVEQAATKAVIVLVSAWSSDPTLSQAFVPWFFNCVPNDNQQAASLFKEIYEIRKYRNIIVVHGKDYDSEKSLGSFMKIVKMKGKSDPIQFNLEDYIQKSEILADKISESNAGCIVLFCQPSEALKLVRLIKNENLRLPVFGPLNILNENALSVQELKYFDNTLSVTAGKWPEGKNQKFRQEFEKIYGYAPGMVASYSYDGMNALIEAIKSAGIKDRELIQKSLKDMNFEGVTGLIKFDEKGNRMGFFETVRIKDGVPVSPK